jgi:hypothetical protein
VAAINTPTERATLTGIASVAVQATDNVGVTRVELFVDGISVGTSSSIGTPFSIGWDTRTASNSTHTLTALATDAAGNSTTTWPAVNVLVDNPPPDIESPTATITSPAAGAVLSGKVAVTVSASDNVGVTGLALLVDDLPVAAPASGPFTLDWDTGTASNNDHTLKVRVRDAAGNVTVTAAVIVTVTNSAPLQPAVVVLYAADVPAGSVFGKWRHEADPSAAAGTRLRHPDANAPKRTTALATPADYFDVTFMAEANVPYHLWIRSRGDANSWANDSVFVQFSNVAGALIGTTGAWSMNLEDCSNCGIAGWGWQDNGYGVVGADLVFTQSGAQIVRIQTKEDGIAIDQIVLSPLPSRTVAPGTLKNDTTIVPK